MDRLARLTALAGLALFVVTWRLWTPQTVFPQVPFLAAATDVPGIVDWILFGGILASLTAMLVPGVRRDAQAGGMTMLGIAAPLLFAASATVSILLDQHRLQPWAYQFVLIAVVLAWASQAGCVLWLRVLVIGIYVNSALSKFDASFLQSHGQRLVDALLGVFGGAIGGLPQPVREALAFGLPLAELLIAAGLAFPRTRRVAVWTSVAMHAALFLALGPWGLNHKPGVLLWNAFFVAQNLVLFGRQASETLRGHTVATNAERLAAAVVVFAVTLPFSEPIGGLDHWPAWALYASHPERVAVFVHASRRRKLPQRVREFTENRPRGWCRVDVDRWSLETLDAPVYPQGRFRLAVALALAERCGLNDGIRVIRESSAERATGRRTRRDIRGVNALRRETARFWINTTARR